MSGSKEICIVCAWRATCQKKFSVSGKDMKCVDFARDVSIKREEEEGEQKELKEKDEQNT